MILENNRDNRYNRDDRDNRGKRDNNYNRDNRDNRHKKEREELSFSDSWKQNNIELAVMGALVVGAGRFGVKGNFSDVTKYSKDSFKHMEKGFDRYLKKKLSPVGNLGKDVIQKTFRQLKNEKIEKLDRQENYDDFSRRAVDSYSKIDPKKIVEEAATRLQKQKALFEVKEFMKQTGEPAEFKPDLGKLIEEVRTEIVEKDLAIELASNKAKKKPGLFVNWKEQLTGNAITGLGFAAGITSFHAADSMIRQRNTNKQKDESFAYGGSLLHKEKGDKRMNKHAGTREIHDGLIDLSKRTPQAIATSLGFTGVSLATGQAMKNKNQKPQEEGSGTNNGNGSRIIIELGNDDPATRASGTHAFAGSPFGGMPHIAHQEKRDMEKLSGLVSFDKAKQFGKNLGGRLSETKPLQDRINEKTINYRDEASESLKNTGIKDEVQKRYGHLHDPNSPSDFFERELLDSEAKGLKRKDEHRLDQIKNEVARDRVSGLGGLIGLGGTAAAVHSMSNRKEDVK